MPNGQYRGAGETPGAFTLWDVGTWAELDSDALELSTANDAHIAYRVGLEGSELTFIAPDGQRIVYRSSDG